MVLNATLANIGRGTVQLKKYEQHTTNYKLGRRLLYCEAKKLRTSNIWHGFTINDRLVCWYVEYNSDVYSCTMFKHIWETAVHIHTYWKEI